MPTTDIVTDPTTGTPTGGTQPTTTTPTVPVAPTVTPSTISPTASTDTKLTPQQINDKWANNPYLVGGRDKWGDNLKTNFNFSGTNVKQSYYNAAKSTGMDPSLVYASSSEEGVQGLFPDKQGNVPFTEDKKYPVDGYVGFGLDNIGTQVPELIKKGLLPPDFANKVKTTTTTNEKGQSVTSSNFTDEDAGVLASAAVLKNSRNNLDAYTKKTGTTLTPRQEDFFNLAAFNLGDAGAQKMLESYKTKGYLKDDKFLDDPNFKPASYGGVYTHVQRRLVPQQYMNDHGAFADYKPPTQPQANLTNQNRTDYNDFVDSKNPSLEDYIKQNPKTSLTPQMAGALQQDLNAHKEHLKNLVNTKQAVYDNGVTHENVGSDTHKFSTAYMAANK